MSIRKVSDLEQLDYSKRKQDDPVHLNNSLIELSYLLSGDNFNHRWYKSVAMSYSDLVSAVADYVGEQQGGHGTFPDGVELSGNLECNAADSWSDIRNNQYHAWLKFNEFGLSACNIGLNTETASVKIDNDGRIYLDGSIYVRNDAGQLVPLKEYIQQCIDDYLNNGFSKTLIKTETP